MLSLHTWVVSEMARAVSAFRVDVMYVYGDDRQDRLSAQCRPAVFVAAMLVYAEVSPNVEPRLSHASLEPGEWSQYRDGVVVGPTIGRWSSHEYGPNCVAVDESVLDGTTLVDVGFPAAVEGCNLSPGSLVTVDFGPIAAPQWFLETDENGRPFDYETKEDSIPLLIGTLVNNDRLRVENYQVGAADAEPPFDPSYDLSIGIFEGGLGLTRVLNGHRLPRDVRHAIALFGGRRGIEYSDKMYCMLAQCGIERQSLNRVFAIWVDICELQGRNTIRGGRTVYLTLDQMRQNMGLALVRFANETSSSL
jgi:hypothetical protein